MEFSLRIAYLVLSHIDANHIQRLALKLTKDTRDSVFIHVDLKSDIKPFEQKLNSIPRVHLLSNRVNVHWGGYSSIEATINLLKEALLKDKQEKKNGEEGYDYFVILQGLEYPIRNNIEIHSFFENNNGKEFIKAQNISLSYDPNSIHKYRFYWYLDNNGNVLITALHLLNTFFLKKLKIIPKLKKSYTQNNKKEKMDLYQGCAQFGITKILAEYIVEFNENNQKFNNYFKTVYAPDESYFHTIVYNSPFIKNTIDGCAVTRDKLTDFSNLTYFEYPSTVRLFTKKEDWQILSQTNFLFVRKVSSASFELLDYIDSLHEKERS